MHRMGEQLLKEKKPNAHIVMGYTLTAWNELSHFHMHAFALPGPGSFDYLIKHCLPGMWMPAERLEQHLSSAYGRKVYK
jgi:hypothetical protein